MTTITRPTPLPLARPTASLPAPAAAALAKLERALLPLPLIRAVARYEAAVEYKDRLSARPASTWSGAEFQSFFDCGPVMAESLGTLEAAGRLDLIAPAKTASGYRAAESRANDLIRSARKAPMSDLHADDLAHYVDLMAGFKAILAEAGRLDLIGVAS